MPCPPDADETNLIGQIFGRLTIVSKAGKGPRGNSWMCLCDCGKTVRLSTFKLVWGGYRSCGEHRIKRGNLLPVPQVLAKQYRLTLISWKAMWARCTYTTSNCYRGIKVCEAWKSFESFLSDLGPRPSLQHSLDRIDPDGDYTPHNCRWSTKRENSSRIRMNLSPERNKKVSDGVKRAHAAGKILTPETRIKTGKGGAKRRGRALQSCTVCGGRAYLPVCQKCREQA